MNRSSSGLEWREGTPAWVGGGAPGAHLDVVSCARLRRCRRPGVPGPRPFPTGHWTELRCLLAPGSQRPDDMACLLLAACGLGWLGCWLEAGRGWGRCGDLWGRRLDLSASSCLLGTSGGLPGGLGRGREVGDGAGNVGVQGGGPSCRRSDLLPEHVLVTLVQDTCPAPSPGRPLLLDGAPAPPDKAVTSPVRVSRPGLGVGEELSLRGLCPAP